MAQRLLHLWCALLGLAAGQLRGGSLPGPGCFIENAGQGPWIACPNCRYDISDIPDSKQSKLSDLNFTTAKNIASQAGADLLFSVVIDNSYDIETKEFTMVSWRESGQGPFTKSPKFDNRSIICGDPEQRHGGLWLRYKEKPTDWYFLTTEQRDHLKHDIQERLSHCHTNMNSAVAPGTWESYFEGKAAEEKRAGQIQMITSLLVLPFVLFPPALPTAAAGSTFISKAAQNCLKKDAFCKRIVEWATDKDRWRAAAQTMITWGVGQATDVTGFAHREVQKHLAATQYLLSVQSRTRQLTGDQLPAMSNQELLMLWAKYDDSEGQSCSFPQVHRFVDNFSDNFKRITSFRSTVSQFWRKGEVQGVCKKGNSWYSKVSWQALQVGANPPHRCRLTMEHGPRVPDEYREWAHNLTKWTLTWHLEHYKDGLFKICAHEIEASGYVCKMRPWQHEL
eukprot:Skav219949  [mRNA]  locus=scaffold2879:130828:132180:+ [translate_table: standard]